VEDQYGSRTSAYSPLLSNFFVPEEQYREFDLSVPDDKLHRLIITSLNDDIAYWNKPPFNLQRADDENINFWLGDQWARAPFSRADNHEVDNRLFAGIRAILSYATSRLATPEIMPSSSDDWILAQARNLQMALYQHSLDEGMDAKVRAVVLNLITRKRGYLKVRFDPDQSLNGDVTSDVLDPSDVVIDRFARFRSNPNKIYQRIRCTLDELCSRFPDKQNDLYRLYGIRKGVFSQLSRYVTYYETWFTYIDAGGKPREGMASFIHDPGQLILDKGPNPNWIYTGDDKKDKLTNVLFSPPKPFINFNYLNLGMSYIDETSLFDQARPMQILLNKRNKQWHDNIDYANGRWVASAQAMSEATATSMVNRGSKTIGLVNTDKVNGDVGKAFKNVAAQALPAEVYQSILDTRNEIDTMLGTPSVFRGGQPEKQNTATRDMISKQQSGMMQDDLVRAIQSGMQQYYEVKLQLMRVFYSDDYTFQAKGGDGAFRFITLTGDDIDPAVKVGVQVDSTLPLDKEMIRDVAQELLKANKIDYLTAMQDLGLPNPEIRTERFFKSTMQPFVYLQSIEKGMDNNEAEMDIQALISNRPPKERDNYDKDYLDYFNLYLSTNRFMRMKEENPQAAQRIVAFLMAVQHVATQTANLQSNLLDAAGMQDSPPFYPPKVDVRLVGSVDNQAAANLAGGSLPTPPNQGGPAPAQAPNTVSQADTQAWNVPQTPGQAQAPGSPPPPQQRPA
jgi:hypothetical protein